MSSPAPAPDASAHQPAHRWRSRPVLASLLRVAVYLIPLSASVATTAIASRVVPPPASPAGLVAWSLTTIVVATVVLVVADRLMRRVLPLATLLKLSMLFPDHAPSRYAVARQVGTTRTLEERIERATAAGQTNEPIQVAEAILELVVALSAHDRRTRGHSERVRVFTDMLAEELHLTDDAKDRLRWASLLHDIGKLVVPAKLLNKPGRPTASEWERLYAHPEAGAAFMGPLLPWLGEWARAIPEHHEKWDGTGYPRRLEGEDISLGARIVAVADAFEVITAPRPYKKALNPVNGREELARCAGTHFDPVVVRAFLNISLGRLRWAMGPISWFAQVPFHPRLTAAAKPVGTTLSQAAAVGALAVGTAAVPAIVRSATADVGGTRDTAATTEAASDAAERRGGLLGALAVAPPAAPQAEAASQRTEPPASEPAPVPSFSPSPELAPAAEPVVEAPAVRSPNLDQEPDDVTPPAPPSQGLAPSPPPAVPAQPGLDVPTPLQPVQGASSQRPTPRPAAPPPHVVPTDPPGFLTTPDLPGREPRPLPPPSEIVTPPPIDTPSVAPPSLPEPPSLPPRPPLVPPPVVPPPLVPPPLPQPPVPSLPPAPAPAPVPLPIATPPPPVRPPVPLPDPPPVQVDDLLPSPAISTAQAAGLELAGSHVVSGTAAPLSTVHLTVDDGVESTPFVTAQTTRDGFYRAVVDASALSDGPVRITAFSTDALGRTSHPATATVIKDAEPTAKPARARHRLPLE